MTDQLALKLRNKFQELALNFNLDPGLNRVNIIGNPECDPQPNLSPSNTRRHAYAVCYSIGDVNCPAFVRKHLGLPLGENIFDPEIPAFKRKELGLKLQPYHMEAQNAGYPFFPDP